MTPRAIIVLVVLIPVYRDPPSSSSFRAAPAVDTTGEPVEEQRPRLQLAKCGASNVVPFRKVG